MTHCIKYSDLITNNQILKQMETRTQFEIVAMIMTIDDVARGILRGEPIPREMRVMDVFADAYKAGIICNDLNERSQQRRYGDYSYMYQCPTTELRPVSGLLDDVWDDGEKIIRFRVVKTKLTEADFWDGDASWQE